MTEEKFIEKLKRFYASTFDLEENYIVGSTGGTDRGGTCGTGDAKEFPLYGHFNVDNSRYVLSKKAKLWEANCQEHLFVDVLDGCNDVDAGNLACDESASKAKDYLNHLDKLLKETIEPELVRHGEKYPPANHMYSYITVVLITEKPLDSEFAKAVKSYKFNKTYKFNIRGYMDTRLVLVSTADKTVITNRAAADLKKAFKRLVV